MDTSPFDNPLKGLDPKKAINRDNPLPGQEYYDPSVREELIADQLPREDSFFAGLLNHGLDSGQPAFPMSPGLAGNDPMAQALANRAGQSAEKYVGSLRNKNDIDAKNYTAMNREKVSKELGGVYGNEVGNTQEQLAFQDAMYDLRNKYESALEAQRQGILGAIFSGLGSLAGEVTGGLIGSKGSK